LWQNPVKKSGEIQVSARYVSALFDVAKSTSVLATVEKDLLILSSAVTESEELAALIASPLLNCEQQSKAIAVLADHLKTHALTKAFLVALADSKRLVLLPEIARQFTVKAEAERGEMTAELVTALPLSSAEIEEVTARLGRAYGKKINLRTREDKRILGGVVVKIGGVQLDSSVAGKLERLNLALKAA
jgi:F-type H+-transporting ATPase subunit delta